MKNHTLFSLLAVMCALFAGQSAYGVNVFWIQDQSNPNDNARDYGSASAPLSFFDPDKWFLDSPGQNNFHTNPLNGVPTDGDDIIMQRSCCNPEPFVDINNGGAGVNFGNSSFRFDAKTNLLDSSAGDLTNVGGGSYNFALVDDGIVADTIAFNGAGGAANDVFVPVTANTFTSNRHGAKFFVPFDVDEILSRSAHQERWEFHVSPIDKITHVELNENRGPDGGNIDGQGFQVFADMEVETMDQIWMRLRVGSGAVLAVDELNYSDYTNKSSNNAINPILLEGDLLVETFNILIRDDNNNVVNEFELAPGTYNANDLAFLSGDGTLTIGRLPGNSVPEPTTAMLSLLAFSAIATRRRKRGEPVMA